MHPVKLAIITYKAYPFVDVFSGISRRTVVVPRDDMVATVTDPQCLFVPRTHSETAKQAFIVAPNIWNSLPNDIRKANYLFTFCNKQKTRFLQ